MKKSMKSILAKTLAFAMAFSLMAIAPGTESEAAAKKPTIKKKVSITVGKTKTVKVTSKKKVKKTTWSLTKKGKKVVSLSKKKAKSVKVKGKKAGKATLTAKVKVGKKTYKLKSKITVTKATNNGGGTNNATPTPTNSNKNTPTPTPGTNGGNNTPTPTPGGSTSDKAGSFTVNGETVTVDESATYSVPLTELNETTFTCESKRPPVTEDSPAVRDDMLYNRDGSVTFTSNKDYNSGVTFYVNPCTSEDQIVDISDTRGEGFLGYNDGTKDMSAYDYVRIEVTSGNELNFRTYNGNDQLLTAGFPGSSTSETYEGGWTAAGISDYMESDGGTGQKIKAGYETRTLFISLADLQSKGCNPATLTAFGICPQRTGEEVTIHSVDFVKVNYDTQVTGITVSANRTEVVNGRTATLTAEVTPANATRKTVAWSSSDESLATVNYNGLVTAAAEGTGKVTITATATDGSDVTGSIELTITDGADQPQKITSHKVDLTSEDIVVARGDATATASAAYISMGLGNSAAAFNLKAYLTKNNIDPADYDSLRVSYQLKNADGTDADSYDSAPSFGKMGLSSTGDDRYNGKVGSKTAEGYLGNFVAGTKELLFTGNSWDLDSSDIGSVIGFMVQFASMDADKFMAITDITFYKDNSVYVDLNDANIVANGNNGSGSDPATKSAAGIEFGKGISMTYVDFSKYLTANSIDLADYLEIQVTWEVHKNGQKIDSYDGDPNAPGYGKTAWVAASKLDGFSDGIDVNWEGPEDETVNKDWLASPYTGGTQTLTIAKTNPADLATVAGFNLQVEKLPADYYIVVTGITFVG